MEFTNNLLNSLKSSYKGYVKNPRSFLTKENVLSLIFILIILMIIFSDSAIISLFIHSTILRLLWLAIAFWLIYKNMITSGLLLLLLFVVALNTHSYIRVNKKTMEHYKDIGADPDDKLLADIESADMTPPDNQDEEDEVNKYEEKIKKEKRLKKKRRQEFAPSSYETVAKKEKIMNAMKKEDFENDRYLPPSIKSKKIDDKFRVLHENFHKLEETINTMGNNKNL
jgi:hypothetical protein